VKRLPGAAVIAVAALAAALIAAGCGSKEARPKPSGQNTAESGGAAGEVSALLAGIPQHGATLGDPRAPVTLEYFGDLQCPYCREFALGALVPLIKRYVRAGTLKIAYRSLETATRAPHTFRTQQIAALAAGRQNKLWNFIELFYHEQRRENSGYVTESYLQGLAQQVSGMNLIQWSAARIDPALSAVVSRDERVAALVRFRVTPGFLFTDAAGNLRAFHPRTLTALAPYAYGVKEMLRLDHRRRARGPLVSSS
jgi:protein-disulfide isomerase